MTNPGPTPPLADSPAIAAAQSAAARRVRHGVLGGTAALIALVAWWSLGDGVDGSALALALILTVPLWLALPGLQRGTRRTYAWMSLATVFYLMLALMELVANPTARAWGALCLFAAFIVFVLLIAYLRLSRGQDATTPAAAADTRRRTDAESGGKP